MHEITITPQMRQAAHAKVKHLQFNSNRGLSKFGSEKLRTIVGYIGEEMVMDFLKIKKNDDKFDYDLTYNDQRLEVKTISCKFKPYPHYLCTVNSHNLKGIHKQSADYYVFLRILNDQSKGWLLGFMPCEEFFRKGEFIEKGSTVVKGVQFVKANATVLPINKLYDMDKLKSNE